VWLNVIVLLSAAAQGFTGFGFGAVGMALTTLLVGPRDSNLLWTLLALPLVTAMWAWLRRSTDWQRFGWLMAGAGIGTPLGVWVLATAELSVLRRIVGTLILVFIAYSLWNPRFSSWDISAAWGVPAGAVSGFFSGAASVGGPAAVVFLLISGLDKNTIKATLAAFFGANLVWKLALISQWEGLLSGWHLSTAGWLIMPLFLGMAGGMWGSGFVSTNRMRRIMCGFLVLPAALLLF